MSDLRAIAAQAQALARQAEIVARQAQALVMQTEDALAEAMPLSRDGERAYGGPRSPGVDRVAQEVFYNRHRPDEMNHSTGAEPATTHQGD